MTDLIKRTEAIQLIQKQIDNMTPTDDRLDDIARHCFKIAINLVSALPSAEAVSREDYHNLLMASNDIDIALREYQAKEEQTSAEAEQTDCTDFIRWLTETLMDDGMWELNAVAYGEVIARKLTKLGVLEVKDGYYIRPSAEAVQGEWTYLSGSKGSYMTISCPICGSTFDDVAEWKYHYCPNCRARMKGGDSE